MLYVYMYAIRFYMHTDSHPAKPLPKYAKPKNSSYSWQFSDLSSTFVCCGKEGDPSKPNYIVTFCPDD